MSTAQTRAHRANAKAKVQVENLVATEVAKRRGRKPRVFTVTAEQLIDQRDTRGLSWKQVAINLELGSVTAARAAYRKLTGRAPSESRPISVQRAPRGSSTVNGMQRKVGKSNTKLWNDDSDQDEIIESITHKDVIVQRSFRGLDFPPEVVHVARITRFAYDGSDEDGELVVHLYSKERCPCRNKDTEDTGVARCFRVADIREVL